ncbi:Inner membrane protein ypdA [uncultured Ruminococcus sp.]|nr:Inner membrane protein ypdA [uncultured Clostridium sp.]SCI39424.1 Inner membrane protein ypdA [uncultured Ruminococcus sp.]
MLTIITILLYTVNVILFVIPEIYLKSVIFLYISFKVRIIALFTVIYLLLASVIFLIYDRQSNSKILYQLRDADLKTAQTISISLDNLFTSIEEMGGLMAENQSLIATLQKANQVPAGEKIQYREYDLSSLLKELKNPIIDDLSFLSSDGYVIGGTPLYKDRVDLIFGPSTVKQLSREHADWLDMFRIQDLYTQQIYSVIPCTIPVYDGQNFLGHLVLFLNEEKIFQNISAYNGSVFILDDNNLIISSARKDFLCKDFYNKMQLTYFDISQDVSTVLKREDQREIVLTAQYYQRRNWQILIMSDPNTIYAQEQFDNSFFISVSTICIITIPIIAILLIIYISKPITQLQNTMKKVDAGDLWLRNPYHKHDEFGNLSTHFNQLLDTVQTLLERISLQEEQKQNYRFQLIQSQINPHFLYNVLELISSFIRLDMKDTALLAVQNISNFYRISLSDGVNIIKIQDEVQLLKQYLCLQEMRYREFMKFTVEVDEAILPYTIPKLTLQPLAENAIYHGLRSCKYPGELKVQGFLEGSWIVFSVTDNGVGFPQEKVEEIMQYKNHQSFGIQSIIHRLKLYFGEEILFEITPCSPGTKITLKIPKKEQ